MKRLLIGCERSGRVREEFRRRGVDAWSCDLAPAEDRSPFHIEGDAIAAIHERGPWDGLIVHPPCTRLALSGALRLYINGKKKNGRDPAKWEAMRQGAAFFLAFFKAFRGPICAENPMMHGHALDLILPWIETEDPAKTVRRYTIQPHQFGDDASKATVLWLRGFPPLMPTHVSNDLFASEPPPPIRKRASALLKSDGQRPEQAGARPTAGNRTRAHLQRHRRSDG